MSSEKGRIVKQSSLAGASTSRASFAKGRKAILNESAAAPLKEREKKKKRKRKRERERECMCMCVCVCVCVCVWRDEEMVNVMKHLTISESAS